MNIAGYTEIIDRLDAIQNRDAAAKLFDMISQLIKHLGLAEYDSRLLLYVRNDYRKRFSINLGHTLVLALSSAKGPLEFQFIVSRQFFENQQSNLLLSDVFGDEKKDPTYLIAGIDAQLFLANTPQPLMKEWLSALKSKLPQQVSIQRDDSRNYKLMWDMAVDSIIRDQVFNRTFQSRTSHTMTQKLYDYIPFFNELNQAIKAIAADEENREAILLEKSLEVFGDNHPIARYKVIEPLSFMYALAQRNTIHQWRQTFTKAKEVFDLDAAVPTDLYFPTPTPNALALFCTDDSTYRNRNNDEIVDSSLLWDFHSKLMSEDADIETAFWEVLNLKSVGPAKLTQCMFLINPSKYLPFDNATKLPVSITTNKEILKSGWVAYKRYLDTISVYFPGCRFQEINLFGYLLNQNKLTPNDSFFQISSKIEGSAGRDAFQDFETQNAVYPGDGQSANGRIVYPLKQPRRGDFILVRRGTKTLGGMGIVLENEFSESGYEDGKKIDIIWLAKAERNLNEGLGDWTGFSNATEKTWNNFKEKYPETFEIIHKLIASKPNQNGMQIKKAIPLNTILYGPPGTGKTFNTIDRAVQIITGNTATHEENKDVFDQLKEDGQISFVTFHPNYTYEDFIIGIKPNTQNENGQLSFKDHKGIFYELALSARQAYEAAEDKQTAARYVLIIDEINRANIARVFGELITLLEDDKRIDSSNELKITLPNGVDFSLPPNLYILGTMNTADKSIALIDIALRRRFEFVSMYPDYTVLQKEYPDRVSFLKQLNHNIYQKKKTADFLVGHAYLLKAETMDEIIQHKIIPLLMEYMGGRIEEVKSLFDKTGYQAEYDLDSYHWITSHIPIVPINVEDATPSLS